MYYLDFNGNTVSFRFIVIIIITSILEEFIFRWGLVYSLVKSYMFLVSSVLLVFLNTYNFLQNNSIIIRIEETIFIYVMYFLIISFLFLKKKQYVQRWWSKNYKSIFGISIILFGISHINNFHGVERPYLISILILPQCIAGYFLGLVRIKFGIGWSIFLHLITNLMGIFIFNL